MRTDSHEDGTPSSGTGRGAPRIVFIQPHLHFGGAESQTVSLLNELVSYGYNCRLILHSRRGGLLANLSPLVDVEDLGFASHLMLAVGRGRLAKVLRQLPPSLVVVRLWSSISLVAPLMRRSSHHTYRFIEDLDPRDHAKFIRFGELKKALIGRIYRRHEDLLVANTQHVASAMRSCYRLTAEPQVIECGVSIDEARTLASEEVSLPPTVDDQLRVVTVGSLINRKGLLVLTKVLAGLPVRVQWVVVGEGPDRDALDAAASAASNIDLVLVGATPNPFPYIRSARVMVHGALSESFGVVLVESLALGVPVVANRAHGPREISEAVGAGWVRCVDLESADRFRAAIMEARASRPHAAPDISRYELSAVAQKWSSVIPRPGGGADG